MKNRVLSLVAMVALLVTMVLGYTPVPMKGSGTGSITGMNGPEITAIGEGEATQLGKYTREEHLTLNPADGTFTGTIVFTAADGSELTCDVAGGFTGPATAAGVYTFTGGTGRFATATGEAFFNVTLTDPANFTVAFAGSIDRNL